MHVGMYVCSYLQGSSLCAVNYVCPHWLVVTISTPSSKSLKSSCKPVICFKEVQSEPVTVCLLGGALWRKTTVLVMYTKRSGKSL